MKLFDCATCEQSVEVGARATMRCGWLPRDTWPEVPDLPQYPIDGELQHPPVCPGWLQRQPLVHDVAKAWRTYDKGQLEAAFPDPASILVEGVFLLDDALAEHRANEMARARREHEHQGSS